MNDCLCAISAFDGTNEMFTQRQVKARKRHKCCECREPIEVGQPYECCAVKCDGEWHTFQTCLLCAEIRDHFSCDGSWVFETTWDDLRDYAFPELPLKPGCLDGLSAAAKEKLLAAWRKWKGLDA